MPSCSWVISTAPPSQRTSTLRGERLEDAHRHRPSCGCGPRTSCGLPCCPWTTWLSSASATGWTCGAWCHVDSHPRDGRERDVHPGRPVAGLVDGLVDGLVGDVGASSTRSLVADLAAGVRHQEVVARCGAPTRRRGRPAAVRPRRRPGRTSARRRAARSRRSGASRRRRARASRAAAARRAAWPARPRSRRSSSPGRCAGSGRGGGRRGPAARSGRAARAARSYVARRASACAASSGTTSSAASSRAVIASASAPAASAPRRSVGKSSARTGVDLAQCLAEPGGLAGEVAADLVGVQVGLGEEVADARRARGPSRRWRCAGTAGASRAASWCRAVVGVRVDPVEPAVERGDVVGAGPGQHVVDLDVGVDARA